MRDPGFLAFKYLLYLPLLPSNEDSGLLSFCLKRGWKYNLSSLVTHLKAPLCWRNIKGLLSTLGLLCLSVSVIGFTHSSSLSPWILVRDQPCQNQPGETIFSSTGLSHGGRLWGSNPSPNISQKLRIWTCKVDVTGPSWVGNMNINALKAVLKYANNFIKCFWCDQMVFSTATKCARLWELDLVWAWIRGKGIPEIQNWFLHQQTGAVCVCKYYVCVVCVCACGIRVLCIYMYVCTIMLVNMCLCLCACMLHVYLIRVYISACLCICVYMCECLLAFLYMSVSIYTLTCVYVLCV